MSKLSVKAFHTNKLKFSLIILVRIKNDIVKTNINRVFLLNEVEKLQFFFVCGSEVIKKGFNITLLLAKNV